MSKPKSLEPSAGEVRQKELRAALEKYRAEHKLPWYLRKQIYSDKSSKGGVTEY